MPTKRGASWQGVVYHKSLPTGRVRRNFSTEREAEAWELDSKARLMRGQPLDLGENHNRKEGLPYTLSELVEHVYRTRWATTTGGRQQLSNANDIVRIIGPSLPIEKLDKGRIDRARATLIERVTKPPTVNRKVAALSTCLSEAMKMDLIGRKPGCDKYDEHEGRIRRFTPEEETEVVDFFERASLPSMADYVLVSLDTGIRQGECLNLRKRDVEGDKLTIWGVGAKSGRTRPVPLTKRAKAILGRRCADLNGSDFVFHDLTKRQICTQWDRLRSKMGLNDDKEFVPHVLRHEFCSRLADRGMNASIIQALAGHSTLAVSQRYIHIGGDALIKAIRALEPA